MTDIPVGDYASAVRQVVDGSKQITGVAPQVQDTGAGVLTLLQPYLYEKSIYSYGDERRRIVLGDLATPNGSVLLRLQDAVPNDLKVGVEVVDGAAEGVARSSDTFTITLNTGVSTYATLAVTLAADAQFASVFSVDDNNAGAVVATAQALARSVLPPVAPVEAVDGGLFVFGPTHASPLEVHLECGAGSVVTISIVDADGTSHPRELLTGVSGDGVRHALADVYMLPEQCLIVEETASGVPAPVGTPKYMTVYVVKPRGCNR